MLKLIVYALKVNDNAFKFKDMLLSFPKDSCFQTQSASLRIEVLKANI